MDRSSRTQDVITGLNITTSVLTGHGGVWVMNPPYLLFYRDTTGDGLPDGEPEVRLSGFGLEDTHSLANSLTWGPDGWLYGVHGSTSTARVRGVSFLGQAVWRYHPETRRLRAVRAGRRQSVDAVVRQQGARVLRRQRRQQPRLPLGTRRTL